MSFNLKAAGMLLGAAFLCGTLSAETSKLEVIDARGYSTLRSSHKGKVLLVNFWATWCVPCRKEMPALVRAARRFKPGDVIVITISADALNLGQSARDFLNKAGATFPAYIQGGGDPALLIDAVDPDWGGELPFTIVYDKSGAVSFKSSTELDEEGFARALEQALRK